MYKTNAAANKEQSIEVCSMHNENVQNVTSRHSHRLT